MAFGCKKDNYVPKPRGFFRIDLPPHEYQKLTMEQPYSFEHSVHAKALPDTTGIIEPNWLTIYYPRFAAQVEITYKDISKNPRKLLELINDSHILTNKHQIKASRIKEYELKTKDGKTAYAFELSGQVPSQFQFYTTDTARHFFRAALYFPTGMRNDSLAPVIKYVTTDMIHMLQTLSFDDDFVRIPKQAALESL